MNINSLTIKAQEVLQSAMNLASGNGNQAVEPMHILSAIVAEDDSLGVFLLQKLGVNVGALRSVLKQQIDRLPKVEGGDPYFRAKVPRSFRKPRISRKRSATNTPRSNTCCSVSSPKKGRPDGC